MSTSRNRWRAVAAMTGAIALNFAIAESQPTPSLQPPKNIQPKTNLPAVSPPPAGKVPGAKKPPGTTLTAEQSAQADKKLKAAGWSPAAKEPRPDPALLELEPSAFVKPSAATALALRSQSFAGESLEKLRRLYRSQIDAETRVLVLEALTESPDPRVEPILREIYPEKISEPEKLKILRRLDPVSSAPASFELVLREAKGGASARLRTVAKGRLASLLLKVGDSKIRAARLTALPPELKRLRPPTIDPKVGPTLPKKKSAGEPEKLSCDPDPKPTPTRGPSFAGSAPRPSLPEQNLGDQFDGLTEPRSGKPEIDPEKLRATRTVVPVTPTVDPTQPSTRFLMVDGDGKFVVPSSRVVGDPGKYRQVVILPTGYAVAEFEKFQQDARKMICDMATLQRDGVDLPVFTTEHRARLVYAIRWIPGGEIGSNTANFGAKLFDHPVRDGKGITLLNSQVIPTVRALRLDPIGVIVVLDVDEFVTANASPPTFLRSSFDGAPATFGIARVTRQDIHNSAGDHGLTRGEYVPMHELAHAALNFLDEYIEADVRDLQADVLDALTPVLVLDGSWGALRDAWEDLIQNYDLRVTEILGNNGSSNISTRSRPATVTSDPSPYARYRFDNRGGMFLSNGTFHAVGNNVMNNDRVARNDPNKPDGDRFDWAHSEAQKDVLAQVFGVGGDSSPRRPNDRLRNAGPLHAWLPDLGPVRLLLHDGDKNHRWHPTKKYEVRVGWWEVDLSQCNPLDIQHPERCNPLDQRNWVWKTMTKSFDPGPRSVDLSKLIAGDILGFVQKWAVENGHAELELGEGRSVNLAAMTIEELIDQSLPAVQWPTPYQDVEVDLSLGYFYWKFRTDNGPHKSGWTAWSPVTVVDL